MFRSPICYQFQVVYETLAIQSPKIVSYARNFQKTARRVKLLSLRCFGFAAVVASSLNIIWNIVNSIHAKRIQPDSGCIKDSCLTIQQKIYEPLTWPNVTY